MYAIDYTIDRAAVTQLVAGQRFVMILLAQGRSLSVLTSFGTYSSIQTYGGCALSVTGLCRAVRQL